MFATQHLGKLIQELGPATWALELLVTQLYDTSPQVAEVAAQHLERACESLDVLRIVVNMQPTLDHLGDVGQPLLMRYVIYMRVQYKFGQ
jgi:rapamycin-insensitive companion of mTOR